MVTLMVVCKWLSQLTNYHFANMQNENFHFKRKINFLSDKIQNCEDLKTGVTLPYCVSNRDNLPENTNLY